MNHPTTPAVRPEADSGLPSDILGALVEHLRAAGLTARRIRALRLGAQHFLAWLDLWSIPFEPVDDAVLCAFRRHDCRCSGMKGERHKMLTSDKRGFMTGALKLVQFLEDEGCIAHPGELDANLHHLDDFIARCASQGYRTDALCSYRSSCKHILIWLHRSRLSIGDVDAQTLERFLLHDCVCPGPFESPRQRLSGSRYDYPFRSFLRYLEGTGKVPVRSLTADTVSDPAMELFGTWLRRHRGIGCGATIRVRRARQSR